MAQTTIISVVVLVFSLAFIFFNTYRLNNQIERRIIGIARLAQTSLASAVWQVDQASARDFINAVLKDPSVVFAQVVTGHEVMAAKASPEFTGQPFGYFQKEPGFRTTTVEIRKYGEWIGSFNLAVSTEGIHHDILINAFGTLVLALALIISISQTTLYFSRNRLFVPLKHLEESATAIANGDLDARIDTSLPGELGSLARATDDMRESVRHLIRDLENANMRLEEHKSSLENTVRERTDELKRKNVTLNLALEEVQNSKQAAEVANLAKSRFLASMSHEIRTPMNAILGMADILWETELTEDQERYVQVFRSAGESLLEILDDILDLSKIEAGHLSLEATRFSLSHTLDRACGVIEGKAQQKQLAFTCHIAPNVPDKLIGDPTRLKQIILNLLGNAIKFTDTGTVKLTVELAPSQDDATMLQFSVSDTGPGIPSNKLDAIFGSFTQADNSTTRKFGGTGLGLAISKQLVRMMNGRIWVESAHGTGSTFHFTARFDAAGTDAPILSMSKAAPMQDKTLTLPPLDILMLEDSKYNAFVIQTYLQGTHCNLTIATNGVDGVEEYRKGNFDCVLMDIQMPTMDGYEATRAIRAWEEENGAAPTPIIAMTAYALIGDSDKSLEAGADYHLAKPVKKSALFDILNQLDDTRPDSPTPSDTSLSDEMQETILACHAALDDGDNETVGELARSLELKGSEKAMSTVAEYCIALREAAEDGADPERMRQLLSLLSEYVERMDRV